MPGICLVYDCAFETLQSVLQQNRDWDAAAHIFWIARVFNVHHSTWHHYSFGSWQGQAWGCLDGGVLQQPLCTSVARTVERGPWDAPAEGWGVKLGTWWWWRRANAAHVVVSGGGVPQLLPRYIFPDVHLSYFKNWYLWMKYSELTSVIFQDYICHIAIFCSSYTQIICLSYPIVRGEIFQTYVCQKTSLHLSNFNILNGIYQKYVCHILYLLMEYSELTSVIIQDFICHIAMFCSSNTINTSVISKT
jgi:hypothetical protein